MTLLELLAAAGKNLGDVKEVLLKAKAKSPDLAPLIDPILVALDAPLDLAKLAAALTPEAMAILKGHFDRRQHSGDAI